MSLFKSGSFLTNCLPRVAVSACLAGHPVRYDGRDKNHNAVHNWLAGEVIWHPVCPEVRAGLGTPRPPVSLVQQGRDGAPQALGRDDPTLNVTAALLQQADHFIAADMAQETITAVLLKSRSPSCGLASTPLLPAEFPNQITLGKESGRSAQQQSAAKVTGELTKTATDKFTDGLFAGRLRTRCPQLLLCEESVLTNKQAALAFLFACRVHVEREHRYFDDHYRPLAEELNCTSSELLNRLQLIFKTSAGTIAETSAAALDSTSTAATKPAAQRDLLAALQAYVTACLL